MSASIETRPAAEENPTTVERTGERELVVTRTFDAPARIVFKAWTTPELIMQWWMPKSFGITFLACEADVRTGGRYRFVFGHPASDTPMEFVGRYVEVVPDVRLVWTNEEGGEAGAVTTVTFTETAGRTEVVVHDLYATSQALDEAIGSGSTSCAGETHAQLDAVLAAMTADLAPS